MKSVLLLCMALVAVGCSQPTESPAPVASPDASRPSSKEPVAAEPAAYTNEKGELFCPVMKAAIASKEAAHGFQDFEGKRYYFCCDKCPDQFKKDPAKFAAK